MSTREAITLRDMRFHARVGILAHEASLPQPLHVDLTVWRSFSGARNSAATALDYRTLYDLVASAVARGQILYLEDLAHELASTALEQPGVERVRITVRKPNVALPGPLAHAEVEVERSRGE